MTDGCTDGQAGDMYLLTGIQASGKSTVAQALAERLPAPAVHVHGDRFRGIVTGRAEMGPDAGPEAHRQLRLRHTLTAQAADGYADAGFSVVVQDVVLGAHLPATVAALRTRPLYVVVLAPRPEVAARRQAERDKVTSDAFTAAALDTVLRSETPRIGLWLDTSELDVAATVDAILDRTAESAVGTVGTVRVWHTEQGWGVVDSPVTPGGCWVHFSAVAGDAVPAAGDVVTLEWEAGEQDVFAFRGTRLTPQDDGPSGAYRSSLTLTFDP
ncbi:AAA family ATPase [Pseudonocardia sp. McavD-2-B]|uniref:AAA family ATPase n=1 Tax=Pseudonocardia sp. McavD-2-B TaxID=2954499 RepID=UPI0020979594|nr:AAA family ATPase [Pseudonocardia sp. McavD-2-B]MCO7192225.1 AAA family ATPase [Pseudonocardia sp. McavD-2-B]